MHPLSREYPASRAVHFPSKWGRIFNKVNRLRDAKKGASPVNVEAKDRKDEAHSRKTKERKDFRVVLN
jgi:hypothetical protein